MFQWDEWHNEATEAWNISFFILIQNGRMIELFLICLINFADGRAESRVPSITSRSPTKNHQFFTHIHRGKLMNFLEKLRQLKARATTEAEEPTPKQLKKLTTFLRRTTRQLLALSAFALMNAIVFGWWTVGWLIFWDRQSSGHQTRLPSLTWTPTNSSDDSSFPQIKSRKIRSSPTL